MSIRIAVSVVLVLGFYLGLQMGEPWWSTATFRSARTYRLLPVSGEPSSCGTVTNLECVQEITFDPGGRVLVVGEFAGRSGRYRLENSAIILTLLSEDLGEQRIRLELSSDQSEVRATSQTSRSTWQLSPSI